MVGWKLMDADERGREIIRNAVIVSSSSATLPRVLSPADKRGAGANSTLLFFRHGQRPPLCREGSVDAGFLVTLTTLVSLSLSPLCPPSLSPSPSHLFCWQQLEGMQGWPISSVAPRICGAGPLRVRLLWYDPQRLQCTYNVSSQVGRGTFFLRSHRSCGMYTV
jgi:hypothetical protein